MAACFTFLKLRFPRDFFSFRSSGLDDDRSMDSSKLDMSALREFSKSFRLSLGGRRRDAGDGVKLSGETS